jgi:hypothetical protein
MNSKPLNRRAFLLSTAGLGGLAALFSASAPAAAFETRQLAPSSKLALQIQNHCSVNAEHDQIQARLMRDLMSRTGTPGTLLTETAYCPICGCPVVASRYVQ